MEIHHLGPVWIVVGHESGARIFGCPNVGEPFELLEKIEHPIGRAKNRELKSDRQGAQEEWGPSGAHHRFDKHLSPTQKNAAEFAKEIAGFLNRSRDLNRYDHLILVAGPKFLGEIQKHLSKGAKGAVAQHVVENLGNIPDSEILAHLREEIRRFEREAGLTTRRSA